MNVTANDTPNIDRPKKFRRTKYIIKPAFQWKYSISVAFSVFLVASVMSTMLYGVLHQQARLRAMSPETYTAEVTFVIFTSAIAFAAITAAGIGIWFIFMTHRICGPLSVMAGYLVDLRNGRFPKLRALRRKDEFKDFYATFADTVDALKSDRQVQLDALGEAMQMVAEVNGPDEKSRADACNRLSNHLRLLQEQAASSLNVETPSAPTSCPSVEPARDPASVSA